jgi:hypothetical protein
VIPRCKRPDTALFRAFHRCGEPRVFDGERLSIVEIIGTIIG